MIDTQLDPYPWRVGVNEAGPRFATEWGARNAYRDWWNKAYFAPRPEYEQRQFVYERESAGPTDD